MTGRTLKQMARDEYFALIEARREAKNHMDTPEGKSQFVALSVRLHAAKGNVPKSLWKYAKD